MNFTQALKNELEGTGVTVQAVLPGATATPFWAKAGRPVEALPSEIVMTAEDMVDASLAGLDRLQTGCRSSSDLMSLTGRSTMGRARPRARTFRAGNRLPVMGFRADPNWETVR